MPYRTGLLVIAAAMLAPSALAEAPQRLEPVEVYGDRPQQAPGSRSVLDTQRIADTAADRPAEILNQAPAVNIQMNSGYSLRPGFISAYFLCLCLSFIQSQLASIAQFQSTQQHP